VTRFGVKMAGRQTARLRAWARVLAKRPAGDTHEQKCAVVPRRARIQAHILWSHSTLGLRVIQKKKKIRVVMNKEKKMR